MLKRIKYVSRMIMSMMGRRAETVSSFTGRLGGDGQARAWS